MKSNESLVSEDELQRYRQLDCSIVLPLLTDYLKGDRDFTALKNKHTNRWHLTANGQDYELLTTAAKWFDTRANRGGGGAIDLAMHLLGLTFKQAVAKLRELGL
ncbi:MAG: hypothetical protein V4646_06730 [Pseudomonadota bacterium]